MSTVTVKVDGAAEVRRALLALPDRLATNSLGAAVNAGAAIIRTQARANAPEWTGEVQRGHPPPGTLRRSIVTVYARERSTYYRKTYLVVVRRGKRYRGQGKGGNLSQDAYYWRWVEFGHYFVPRFAGNYTDYPLRGRGRLTGLAARQQAASQFIPAQPFMRPAYTTKKEAAMRAIMDKLRERIAQHAAEVRR